MDHNKEINLEDKLRELKRHTSSAEDISIALKLYSEGLVDNLYSEAKKLRNNDEDYLGAVKKLEIAKTILDPIFESKREYADKYYLICSELACGLLLISGCRSLQDAETEKLKEIKKSVDLDLVKRSIELSKIAYHGTLNPPNPNDTNTKKINMISSHNLNYGYHILALSSEGDDIKKYLDEATKYSPIKSDPEELGLRNFKPLNKNLI